MLLAHHSTAALVARGGARALHRCVSPLRSIVNLQNAWGAARSVGRHAPAAPAISGVRRCGSATAKCNLHGGAVRWRRTLPFGETLEFDGQQLEPSRVIDLVGASLTAERVARIDQVVSSRTYDVVPVVEGLYDMGNLAAVCRSADALGFGAMHVITKGEKYKKSRRTSAGADKWLHVTAHDSTEAAVAALKGQGFQLVVTHLGPSSVSIQDVDWARPTAVVLGNEAAGVSPELVAAADVCAVIPMSGFVESFNISVAAALVMYEARRRRQEVLGHNGDLSPEEQQSLRAHLMVRALKNSENILRTLLARPPPVWQEGRFKAARSQQLLAALADQQVLTGTQVLTALADQQVLTGGVASSSSSSSSWGRASTSGGVEGERSRLAAADEAEAELPPRSRL